jgi:hypothetical protein
MLKPMGFWSYSTADDRSSRGRLSRLRSLVAAEIEQQVGPKQNVYIFQDVDTIRAGFKWERQINDALAISSFVIPIITPRFFQSEWCCREIALFRETERRLGRDDLIFPIHYVDVDHVDSTNPGDCQDRSVLELLRARQWADFRKFRHRNYQNENVGLFIESLVTAICTALRKPTYSDLPRPRIPDQTRAPVKVKVFDGKLAREDNSDSPLRAAERDFDEWREPVIDHIGEALSAEFRQGTNHSSVRNRLSALYDLLKGPIADVKDRQFRVGYEIERFGRLVGAYATGGDDMPSLNAASLADIDHLRVALSIGVSKLDRWAEFQVEAIKDPKGEGDGRRADLSKGLDSLADQMARQPTYFPPELPESFRFLAECVRDPLGATKTIVYGAAKSAENLVSFLSQRALGIGKKSVDAVEGHIGKAVAASLVLSLSAAALDVSAALPQGWSWLKPVLEVLAKPPAPGG